MQVRNSTASNFGNVLFIYVIPCKGDVKVEIKHKKKVIETRYTNTYTKLEILNPTVKDRYVIRVTNKQNDTKSVEVSIQFDLKNQTLLLYYL